MEEQPEGMEQPEQTESSENRPAESTNNPAIMTSPQSLETVPNPCVYAIGRIEARFPTLALEREFAQAAARAEDTAGRTDRETLQHVLSENRYLARQMCWVLGIRDLDTYVLQPRDPADYQLLVEALRSAPRPTDVDVLIGTRGPIVPPEICGGLMAPMVVFDQIYSFDVDSLVQGVPRPDTIPEDQEEPFRSTAEELFYRIMQMTDNAGATDEHRALNYLAVRYDRIYAQTAEAHGRNLALTAVETRLAPLSGPRTLVRVIFSYTNRQTDVTEKYYCDVDTTHCFPFLVTKLSPFFEH
jgi:hypothetical protein